MNRATNYLLIDISNSFTKLAFASPKRICRTSRIETEKFTSAFLHRFIKAPQDRHVRCLLCRAEKEPGHKDGGGKDKDLVAGPACETWGGN